MERLRSVSIPSTHVNPSASLQMFVTEVNSHRDHIIELDQTGTHLKYFSQKQDVVLIKNLLLSVQGRWEKLVQRSVERGRQLDDARKRAKQVRKQALFHCCLAFFYYHWSVLEAEACLLFCQQLIITFFICLGLFFPVKSKTSLLLPHSKCSLVPI